MLPLKSILMHRLREMSKIIEKQLKDYQEGKEVELEDKDTINLSERDACPGLIYNEVLFSLISACNTFISVMPTD